MKALSAVLGGFVLTLAVFGSGLAFAVWLLAAEPVRLAAPASNVAELWPREPRTVNPASQRLERLPARPVDRTKPADAAASAPDTTATSSIQPAADEPQAVPAAHVEWCASHYRSYRPIDNRYTSYSGQQHPCISPYLDAGAADRAWPLPVDGDNYVEASDAWPMEGDVASDDTGGAWLSPDHVDYCFSRYRSYRPEDNSYQPYFGGPRRQCE